MAYLTVVNGPGVGRVIELTDQPCTIGRHPDCDVVFDVRSLSRRHAQITKSGSDYIVEDLQSRNGTYRNGTPIASPTQLQDGDRLRLTSVVLVISTDETTRNVGGWQTITQMKISSVRPLVAAGGLNVPDYLAPEQIDQRPDQPVTIRVDVHALGVMMYQMLLGELPLPQRIPDKLLAIANRQFASAVETCEQRGINSVLAPLIDRCLAGSFPNAGVFQTALNSEAADLMHEAWQANTASPQPRAPLSVGDDQSFFCHITDLLFEDASTEAYGAEIESSKQQMTVRLFKPGFQSAVYAEMARELATTELGNLSAVPPEILVRYLAGRARPMPVRSGLRLEIDPDLNSSGALCLVEEFAGNRTLLAEIESRAMIGNERRVAAISHQILTGLDYAHRHSCAHANLTPYCIFLHGDAVKIEGFGLHTEVERQRMDMGGDISSVSSVASLRTATASSEQKIRALQVMASHISDEMYKHELLPAALEGLFEVFPHAERGCVLLRGENDSLQPAQVKIVGDADDDLQISNSVVHQAMRSQEAILSMDMPKLPDEGESIASLRIRSIMCAPLVDQQDQAIGAIHIDTRNRRRFDDADLDVLATLARTMAAVIHRAKDTDSD